VVGLAVLALAAVEGVPPPSLPGPHFACRMTDRAGGAFEISGHLGSGRRRASTSGPLPAWNYLYRDARVADSQTGFDGAAIDATTSGAGDGMQVVVRYLAGRNGRRITIGEGGLARLTEENTGDVIADGTCRLVFAPRIASQQLEPRR
jgi:hypothetical protein